MLYPLRIRHFDRRCPEGQLSYNSEMLIYLIRNKQNGKVYIGKWHGKSVKQRWAIHCAHAASHATGRNHFHAAIRKYGADSFEVTEICRATSAAELADLEKKYIAEYRSYLPDVGYNMTMGGEGAVATAELRAKKSAARMGFVHSEETKRKISESHKGERNPFFGKTHTAENRRLMSEASKRKAPDTPEQAAWRSARVSGRRNPNFGKPGNMRGKHHTEEAKRKMSQTRRARGIRSPMKGQKASEQARQHLIESWQIRKLARALLVAD